jgi:hypothetical protein
MSSIRCLLFWQELFKYCQLQSKVRGGLRETPEQILAPPFILCLTNR